MMIHKLWRRGRLSQNSVKEALDNLPSGVCFFNKTGLPVLCNRRMHQIYFEMTGRDMQSIFELHAALGALDETSAVRCLDKERGIYIFPDDTIHRFSESAVTDENGAVYTQVIVSDVTELMNQEQQLKEQQRGLAAVTAKIEELRRNARSIAQEEQTLAMKARIHDDLGACIAAAHQCLVQGKSAEEIRRNNRLRKEAIAALLQRQQGVSRETLASVREKAADIGVAIVLNGELPTDEETLQTLLYAIAQGAGNCVKHAQGSEVTVCLKEEAGQLLAELTNNGKAPDGAITEGGGLSTLRRRVESMGGTMLVESAPVFRLKLQLPFREVSNA